MYYGKAIRYTKSGRTIVPENPGSIGGTVCRGGTPATEPGYYHRYRLTGASTVAGTKRQLKAFIAHMSQHKGFEILVARECPVYRRGPIQYSMEIVYAIPSEIPIDIQMARFRNLK